MSNKINNIFEDLEKTLNRSWKKMEEQKVDFKGLKKNLEGLSELKVFVEKQIEKDQNKIKELKELIQKAKHGGNVG